MSNNSNQICAICLQHRLLINKSENYLYIWPGCCNLSSNYDKESILHCRYLVRLHWTHLEVFDLTHTANCTEEIHSCLYIMTNCMELLHSLYAEGQCIRMFIPVGVETFYRGMTILKDYRLP